MHLLSEVPVHSSTFNHTFNQLIHSESGNTTEQHARWLSIRDTPGSQNSQLFAASFSESEWHKIVHLTLSLPFWPDVGRFLKLVLIRLFLFFFPCEKFLLRCVLSDFFLRSGV